MDIEERMSKAEAEIAALKETQRLVIQGQAEIRASMERGFAEQRAALSELRDTMERGFVEQRAALSEWRGTTEAAFIEERTMRTGQIVELRQEMQRGFRWTFSALLSILALVLGIIARLAGAW